MGILRLINGLPTMVTPYESSIYYSAGLSANTTITLPNSGSFSSSTGADILIMVNGTVKEITRDFITVGSAPYTQIQFVYALSNDSVLHIKQIIG